MRQIDYLIEDLEKYVLHRASVGVSAKIIVYTASQNLATVWEAAGKLAYRILKGTEWNDSDNGSSELTLRTKLLLKDLFFSKRIMLDVFEKDYPWPTGNYVSLDVGTYEKIYYDLDTCDKVIQQLTTEE